MQLTRHTDYALRLLIRLAEAGDGLLQIADIAEEQAISRSHLMKIANELARAGYIEAQRGRGGGIRLGRDPGAINVADVVRDMEPQCAMVDCGSCRLIRRCSLPGALEEAVSAFRTTLSRYTLADIVRPQPSRVPAGT